MTAAESIAELIAHARHQISAIIRILAKLLSTGCRHWAVIGRLIHLAIERHHLGSASSYCLQSVRSTRQIMRGKLLWYLRRRRSSTRTLAAYYSKRNDDLPQRP